MFTHLFTHYAIRPELVRANRRTPEWLCDLQRTQVAGEIHPGDDAPVLRGDDNDGIALGLATLRWGMPNRWMASKGLDPLAGLVSFTSIDQEFARSDDGGGYGRCLVPLTSFIDADGVELRDPHAPLLTLAGLVGSVEVDGVYATGMCVLTQTVEEAARSHAAPLVVAPANYNAWMDGWHSMAQVRNCCSPVLHSRLVAV